MPVKLIGSMLTMTEVIEYLPTFQLWTLNY